MSALALAAAPASALPVERDYFFVAGPAAVAVVDPIYPAIQAAEDLDAAFTVACKGRDEDNRESCRLADEAADRSSDSMRALTLIVPRTAVGVVALAKHYVAQADLYGAEVGEYGLRHLARAVEAHVEQGFLGSESLPAAATADPIIAAIDAAQAADRALTAACERCDEDDEALVEARDAATDRSCEAMEALTRVVPATPAGLIALARHYLAQATADALGREPGNLSHLARAVEVQVAQGLLRIEEAPRAAPQAESPTDPIIGAIDAVQVAYRAHMAALKADGGEKSDEAGHAWDRAFHALLVTTPTTTAGLLALGQYHAADARRAPNDDGAEIVEHLVRAIDAVTAAAYLVEPPNALTGDFPREPDPILAAIRRHRDAWQAFQDAPDVDRDDPQADPNWDVASAAEDEESDAGQALLATTCASRAGVAALAAHLSWYVLCERDNLIRQDVFGQAYLAAQANLQLAFGARS